MKKIWITIKENKVATIAIIVCIVLILLLVYVFRSVKPAPDDGRALREAIKKDLDSITNVQALRYFQSIQEERKRQDSLWKSSGIRETKIIKTIEYRDKIISAVPSLTTDSIFRFIRKRYDP